MKAELERWLLLRLDPHRDLMNHIREDLREVFGGHLRDPVGAGSVLLPEADRPVVNEVTPRLCGLVDSRAASKQGP